MKLNLNEYNWCDCSVCVSSAGDMSASSPKTDDMIQLYVTGIPNEMNDVSNYNGFYLVDMRSKHCYTDLGPIM